MYDLSILPMGNFLSHLCCLVLPEGINIEWILQNGNRPTEYGNRDNVVYFCFFLTVEC